MVCKNCGTECSDVAFCPNCGEKLEIAEVPFAEEAIVETSNPGKGKGIAALILGIASLALVVLCWCPYVAWFTYPVALILGIVGAILGSSGKRASEEAGFSNGPAKVGKILSIIGIILAAVAIAIVALILVLALVGGLAGDIFDSGYSSAYSDYYYYY